MKARSEEESDARAHRGGGATQPAPVTPSCQNGYAAKLREEMARQGTSFKETVNSCLRRGLEAPSSEELARPFRVKPLRLGLRPGVQLDDIAGLLEALDGATRR